MKKYYLNGFFLILASLLWSFHVIVAKIIVENIPPLMAHSLRMFFASLFFLPFFIIERPWQNKGYFKLCLVSVLASVNMVFFMIGIKYTSAAASQVIYALMPVVILLFDVLSGKRKFTPVKFAGVFLGFSGVLMLIISSINTGAKSMTGTFAGNALILIAMSGWLSYIMFSKRFSKEYNPSQIGSTAILSAFIISLPLVFFDTDKDFSIRIMGFWQWAGVFFMGLFGSFFPFLLFQTAIRNLSELSVSLSSYLQPVMVAGLSFMILGEKTNTAFILSMSFVIAGVLLATTVDLLVKRGIRQNSKALQR